MAEIPFTFLMWSSDGYVDAIKTADAVPMRLNRLTLPGVDDSDLTYGQYFRAIAAVLTKNDYASLLEAVHWHLGKEVSSADLRRIRIFAEKHGSDYHPARIEVELSKEKVTFVMNVAATDRGRLRLASEFNVLKHLNEKFGYPYLPEVFSLDDFTFASTVEKRSNVELVMFLGKWFDGYHEFHLSKNIGNDATSLVVWDGQGRNRLLESGEGWQVYRQAARIMTLYYDVKTFEQIFPWHHAAGDFVVSLNEPIPKVRLITARQYGPMVDPEEGVPVEEGLLFFLLNLSLRMRLDRFDGTGAVAWADASCVEATVDGFSCGLEQQEQEGRIAHGKRRAFFAYCRALEREAIAERCLALVNACDPRAPDIPILHANLGQHIAAFCCALDSVAFNPSKP